MTLGDIALKTRANEIYDLEFAVGYAHYLYGLGLKDGFEVQSLIDRLDWLKREQKR